MTIDEIAKASVPEGVDYHIVDANKVPSDRTFRGAWEGGGVDEPVKINMEKASILYDYLDDSNLFSSPVQKESRSLMNIPFVTGNEEIDAKFIKEAQVMGLKTLKGHRTVGGMRASIYNAMPIEGVKALVDFMKEFEENNK